MHRNLRSYYSALLTVRRNAFIGIEEAKRDFDATDTYRLAAQWRGF